MKNLNVIAQELLRDHSLGSVDKIELEIQRVPGYTLKMVVESNDGVDTLELLGKYKDHVFMHAGTSFMRELDAVVEFTPAEIKLLNDL